MLAIKEIDNAVTDFAYVFAPHKFDAVVEAINVVAKLDPVVQEYKSPATAADFLKNVVIYK